MEQMSITKLPETNQLVLERAFKTTAQKLFNAFTNADSLAQWWGPRGWETITKELTVEPGGHWHYGMKCMDENQGEWFGKTSWGLSVYESIDEPNGFIYTDYFCDENAVVDTSMPTTRSVMQFRENAGVTTLTSTVTCESKEAYEQLINMGMLEGTTETWDRLKECVEA